MRVGTPVSLDALTASIGEDLEGVEREIRRMLTVEEAPVQDLLEHIGRFSGKRLRPALTLLPSYTMSWSVARVQSPKPRRSRHSLRSDPTMVKRRDE